MWVTLKTILPVLLWVCSIGQQEVSCTGWKPIPPPPGLYLSKTGTPIQSVSTDNSPLQEYRFEHQSDETLEALEDNYRKHQKFDIFTAGEDSPYPKDIKPYKTSISVYERGRKRPTFSYSSFNTFPSKVAPIYIEKPGIKYIKPAKTKFLNQYKYHNGHSANEVTPFGPFGGKTIDDHCPLYKVSFRQDLYFQYIKYKVHMPELKEFTLCMWNKFHNHSYDYPLFSYAVRHQPKAIYVWVSNTERSNYYNMKINGHPILRLNYPIRLNRWYHTCQSWNSKTGEWQVWVNSKRIGRGFHNLLVGHVIPGGGIAISGQEQLQYGGGFLEAADYPKGSGGLIGEITMVQLYRIALSAGKAYTDHRHHHSHFTTTTPEPPEIPTEEPLPTPEHPFLENGQLKKPLKVFELAESLRTKGNSDTSQSQLSFADFYDGHFVNPYLSQAGHFKNAIQHLIFKRNENGEVTPRHVGEEEVFKVKFAANPGIAPHIEKIKFQPSDHKAEYQDWSVNVHRSRRTVNETEFYGISSEALDKTEQEENDERTGRGMSSRKGHHGQNYRMIPFGSNHAKRLVFPGSQSQYFSRKEHTDEEEVESKKISKKQVILGDIHFWPYATHDFGYTHNNVPIYSINEHKEPDKESDFNPLDSSKEEELSSSQPEPAEEEVSRIMNVCSGCDRDPYRKVAVISWRSTPKQLYSGALFIKARSQCRKF